jgi:hypothetical protein
VGESSVFIDPTDGCYVVTRPKEVIQTHSPQDQEVIDILNQTQIPYKLVDLCYCRFITRLKARISGIKTPTLILNERKIIGVENIKQALKDFKI